MTHNPSGRHDRAAVARRGLGGMLLAGVLFVAAPALAQDGDNNDPPQQGALSNGNPDPSNNNEGCGKGAGGVENQPGQDVGKDFEGTHGNCNRAVPAPLAAAGIPGLAILGGGYIALRKRRRDSNFKK